MLKSAYTDYNDRLFLLYDELKHNKRIDSYEQLAQILGTDKGEISKLKSKKKKATLDNLSSMTKSYPDINVEWLLTGEGEIFRTDSANLIPFYDTEAIGGKSQYGANMAPLSKPTAYINPGDLLRGATAVLRYYGDSMKEYPVGCVLALKRLYDDLQKLPPGRNYVIETTEDRFVKRIQIGDRQTHYMAYSTNEETYADGRLIHEPFKIRFENIKKVFLVVGSVRYEALGEMLYEPNE